MVDQNVEGKPLLHNRPGLKRISRPVASKRALSSSDSSARVQSASTTTERAEVMAASFLQYCAMCEKQITTPSNSILYCSQACRRKDSNKPLSASSIGTETGQTTIVPSSPRPILTNRASTGSSYANTPLLRIPADIHDAKSDLDPTEWKPKLSRASNSEAFQYLSKYYKSATNPDNEDVRVKVPRLGHNGIMSMSNTPSLGTSPTSAPSSFDSYDFNTRPLPPRQNPLYATSAGGRGVDLVTPHIAPPVTVAASAPPESELVFWEKRSIAKTLVVPQNSLGALLSRSK